MTRHAWLFALVLALPAASAAQEGTPSAREPWSFGAVVAPTTMPDGMTALYGYVGVPEMGVGFRQGISGFEVEGRARLDYFRLAGIFEVAGRKQVLVRGDVSLAPTMSLGLVLNSGSVYLDEDNYPGVLLRLSPGAVASYRVAETVSLLGLVDLPLDLGLNTSGQRRFQALAGGGTELYLAQGVTLLVAAQLGVESFKHPREEAVTRLGYQVRLGIGARLF
ncbi:MAG TPA: hypothetical protein VF815_00240 [Myxococcaceae bacterium]|jgi:hypothetical protein